MFYIVYRTTNKVNGKFYIGCHKTGNLDDGYVGSGKLLSYAIKKYGLENFEREILFVFDNPQEMFDKEAEIVTDEFLAEQNCYNLKKGGAGGFDWINGQEDLVLARNRKIASKRDYSDTAFREKVGTSLKACNQSDRRNHRNNLPSWRGRSHKEETRRKIGDANKKFVGIKNSQFGSIWITNGVESKKWRGELPDGWSRGRNSQR